MPLHPRVHPVAWRGACRGTPSPRDPLLPAASEAEIQGRTCVPVSPACAPAYWAGTTSADGRGRSADRPIPPRVGLRHPPAVRKYPSSGHLTRTRPECGRGTQHRLRPASGAQTRGRPARVARRAADLRLLPFVKYAGSRLLFAPATISRVRDVTRRTNHCSRR